jgi:hypothetical protein
MKNRIFGLAILIITLVFGMTVLGCDDSSSSGDDSSKGSDLSKGGNSSDETVNADGTINLIENKWANGNITSGVGEILYTFKVSIGRSYNIWLNDAAYGDRSKTLRINVSAYYSNGTTIFSNESYGYWTYPKTFVSTSNDTVYLRVAPYSSGGTGTFAIVYSTSTNKPPVPILPNAPTGISAYDNAPSSITIIWNTVSDATGYKIYRSTSSSGSFVQVGSSTSNSYTDTGLSDNTIYYYRITAYNSNGESSQSETVSATASSDTWTNVTSLAQINGTWKREYSDTYTYEGITQNWKQEIIYTINASAKTTTYSFKDILTFSGSGSYFNSTWNQRTSQYSYYTPGTHTEENGYYDEEGNYHTDTITYTVTVTNSNGSTIYTITYSEGYYTIEINESAHTITQTMSLVTQTLTNEEIAEMLSSGIQINQNGTKMRVLDKKEGTITYTKQ